LIFETGLPLWQPPRISAPNIQTKTGILGFIIQNIPAQYFARLCAPGKNCGTFARKATLPLWWHQRLLFF
jgi:hypothetical protein